MNIELPNFKLLSLPLCSLGWNEVFNSIFTSTKPAQSMCRKLVEEILS